MIHGLVSMFIVVIWTFSYKVSCQGPACQDHETIGPSNPQSYDEDLDKDTGFGYVMYGDPYIVECCGTIVNWEFSIGDNADIELQVWRPIGNNNKKFRLVGVNRFDVTRKDRKIGYVSYDIEPENVIGVERGDVLGWYAPGDSLVEYKTGTNYNGIWKIQHDENVELNSVVDFSDGISQTDRTYGIQATLAPNSPPEFEQLPETSIRMDADIGTVLYTVKLKDTYPSEKSSIQIEMTTQSVFFNFNSSTNAVVVANPLVVQESSATYDLEFRATDHCGDHSKGNLRVTVEYVNDVTETTTTEDEDGTSTSTTSTTFAVTDWSDEKDGSTQETVPLPESSTADSSDAGLIAGVVVAVVVIVAIIIILGCVIKTYALSKKTTPKDAEKAKKRSAAKKSTENKPSSSQA